MNAHITRPIAVGERSAAAMLDMTIREFCELVASGALPEPKDIGGHKRWIVSDLEAILSGEAARPNDAFAIAI